MPRLQELYRDEIVPKMMERFPYHSVMEVPRLEKIVVNVGVGEALQNAKALDAAVNDLTTITGQRAGERMYSFLDRLINIALPRQRDFGGVPRSAFDGRGNYTLGLREQLVFLEIDYDTIDKVRGLEVTIITSADTDEEARYLLEQFGMPFARQ